jgi:hypothetical protein
MTLCFHPLTRPSHLPLSSGRSRCNSLSPRGNQSTNWRRPDPGEKGTATSDLLLEIPIIPGCLFSCDPTDLDNLCSTCVERLPLNGGPTRSDIARRHVRFVTLPFR